jgi:hypothetical protein
MSRSKKIIKKTGKIILFLMVGVLLLLGILLIYIHTDSGKRFVKNKVESYLENKLKTNIEIGSLDYRLPQWISLKKIYIQDRNKDTLLSGDEIRVDIKMLKLINGETDIEKIFLSNVYARIQRPATDSNYNYQFIIDAFDSGSETNNIKDTASLKISLAKLTAKKIRFVMEDAYAGINMSASLQELNTSLKKFQPDKLVFLFKDFSVNGLNYNMRTVQGNIVSEENNKEDSPVEALINADKISLSNIQVGIEDMVTGMVSKNQLQQLISEDLRFDMSHKLVSAARLNIDSAGIVFKQAFVKDSMAVKISASTQTTDSWKFSAGNFNTSRLSLQYDDPNVKPALKGFDPSHIDAGKINIAISGFQFSEDSTSALVKQFTFADKSGFRIDSTHADFSMNKNRIAVNDIYLKTPNSLIRRSFSLSYDSLSGIQQNPQNSLIEAVLAKSVISFNDIYLLMPELEKSLPPASFANQTMSINTGIRGNLKTLFIPYLELSGLSGSSMAAKAVLYNLTDTRQFAYDLTLLKGRFLKSDLIKFIPKENLVQFKDLPAVIDFTGNFKGNKDKVDGNLNILTEGFAFNGNISLANITDPSKLTYGFNAQKISVTKKILQSQLPPALLTQIELPDYISMSGKLEGNKENLRPDLKINSSYGDLQVKGYINHFSDSMKASYDLAISTSGFQLGKLIRQDSVFGIVAGNFSAKGTGYDYKTMQASVKGDLDKFAYNQYVYNNVLLDARFNKGLMDATGSINDTAARLQFSATANLHDRYPTVNASLDIDTLRLQALHFTDSLLDLSGKLSLRADNLQPHRLSASLLVDTFNIRTSTTLIPLDSVSLVASSANGIDSIKLNAPFAKFDAGGNFEYDKLPASLQQYIRNYYQLPGKFEITDSLPLQQLAFNGTIIPHPLFEAVNPELKIKEVISLDGSFYSDAADSALNMNIKTAAVAYGDNTLSNALFTVRSSSDLISNRLQFDTLQSGGNTFYQSDLNANLGQDRIYLNASTKDKKGKDWFGIKGYAALMEDVYRLRITDTVLLNHEDWIAASDNYIEYSPAGLVVNNFLITSDTARIFIQSEQEKPNSPIAINIDNFNLSNLSSLVSSDTVFLSGILDVKARVDELDQPLPAFAGDATISGLMVENKPIGDIVMNAAKTDSNSIAANARLTGNGNDLLLKGKYYLSDSLKQFDANLDIKKLNVKTIEALSDGMLTNSSGNLHGSADLYGRFDDPRWKGKLVFDTTQFTVAQLGSPYRIDNQSISFEYPKLVFDNLLIKDSLNHALKIDGNIAMIENGQMAFNLDLNANDFILLNSKKALSNQFFGFASVDANVSVSGTSESPKIEGDVLLNKKSDITIILPETSYGEDDGNTIVRFIDTDTFNLNESRNGFTQVKTDKGSFGKYLFYNLNLEVNKDASLKIIVDPVTGDEVQVRGDARLNAGVDPGGNLVLAGVYELDQGYYVLNYQFLQRKFNLLKGSTIVFAGAPQDADVNISAEYITNTTARDLLGNEITDVNPAMANALRQKLPFKVLLYVKGKLTKPEISFDIQLDATSNQLTSELKTTIESKLQQLRTDAAATNKQVFSLLLLGRFVGEQSSDFFKGNGADFTDIARQSVSQFLSSALNEIASDIFKGIDVDLNLNSYNDFRTGAGQQRTDVNLAVSKSFFDERLTVTVGKNFGLEGEDPTAKASRNSSGFRPDVTVAYKLTRDGKYMIRAYTKNQFEVILDGYVVENGVSFVVTLDYDKFRELFRKPIKKN